TGRHTVDPFALREFLFAQTSRGGDPGACAVLNANLRALFGHGTNRFEGQPPPVDFNDGGLASYRTLQFGLEAVTNGGRACITIASWSGTGISRGSRVHARPLTVIRRGTP